MNVVFYPYGWRDGDPSVLHVPVVSLHWMLLRASDVLRHSSFKSPDKEEALMVDLTVS